ncbi:zinc-dependent alcohol dehydrogenase family protein [Alicyclobacillus macrosporangiidus]|uniref:2-desacetyl-2-hydroxyethyl bacteriochlorophyllide A dehydrogenase n=1 Tax=Alicyclobacillus macrosporangiidus TaxID=392015 RepID=A0A1I7GHV1_9BACL|nr:zinc-dependent alcohol dehydrogenase family protein [Alicyclobacillus macrosporangiidus]SFU47995.1 2-desacetyl-2-hydroxyethyl bacteriochlorophyllide A dehydrogenase [Alicyclobacillus macrosporangiidus]
MRAVVLVAKEQMEMRELPTPEPGPGEVRVQVRACGICGTDVHIYHGKPGSAEVRPPIVLGHEVAGVIDEVGPGVSDLRPGDRVTVDPNIYCHHCRYCRDGRQHLCEHLQAVGVTRDGGMAEFCTVPAANCYRLPDELSFIEGALMEPLGCCLHGIERLSVHPGQSALVIGGGYIGLMMVQLLDRLGASPIVVSEPDPAKRALAERFGARLVVDPADVPPEQLVVEQFGSGADLVVECVGRPETMQAALRCAGRGGQVLLFGVADPATAVQLSPYDVFARELTIRGSFINPDTHARAIALARDGKIQVSPLVSHRFSLEEIPDVLASYGGLRVTKGLLVFE